MIPAWPEGRERGFRAEAGSQRIKERQMIPHHRFVKVWRLKLKGERYGEGGVLAREAALIIPRR